MTRIEAIIHLCKIKQEEAERALNADRKEKKIIDRHIDALELAINYLKADFLNYPLRDMKEGET